ncbi:AraC family transcriptional regulator [Stutzerimonas stutzeri]|jgi:AraC-like DNA-binding protein|uniref:AraC family transcriptional regulator n=1 Tax=Stutzerimonas stutzeri TaxID=316 RepID=A0A5S5BHR4_STUST|nr:AraC family transcriptional regulator [Stutzerimonas stutzeri]TYP66529.1 AraC family transcriptional regulator [Stutzerimonas stutzeri]
MNRDGKGTISVRLVEEALQGFTAPSRSAGQLLHQLGLDAIDLSKSEARIDVAEYSKLWRRLARHFDDEFFGMDPRRMRTGSFAFVCRAAMAQPTLDSALRVALDFFRLTFEGFAGELYRSESLAEVTLTEPPKAQPLRAFSYFTFWMLLHGLACWLVGRRIPLLAVELRCNEPTYTDDYRVMFSRNLRFARPTTRIIFAAEALDLPVRRSEQELHGFLAHAPSNILVKYRDTTSLASRIKAQLRELPAEEWPTSEALAQTLCISASTLRRRLAEAGQTYQAIKDQVRQEMATLWLADASITYAEIAERLGFADVSSFYKAFRKWSGTNPGQYRSLILRADEPVTSRFS